MEQKLRDLVFRVCHYKPQYINQYSTDRKVYVYVIIACGY